MAIFAAYKTHFMRPLKFLLLIGSYFMFLSNTYSQTGVGINTTDPRTTLEIGGDMNVDGDISIKTINRSTSRDEGTFLIQTNESLVKDLHASGEGFAIAYFQEYELRNMNGDWVDYLVTGIPAADYVVTITSAYFNQELTMDGTASSNFTIPYTSAYVVDGIWRIRADYPSASKKGSSEGVWVITTMILSKTFSKQFPVQTFNVNRDTKGEAIDAVIK